MSLVALLCIFFKHVYVLPEIRPPCLYVFQVRSNYCLIQRYNQSIFFIYYILPNHSRIWLPIEAAILHCSETFMLAFIVTPKSFVFTVLHRIVHPISLFAPVFPCPACRHLHFSKLNNLCHFSDHLINVSMSSCSCYLSPFPLFSLKSSVSSANFNILLVTYPFS